MATTTLLDILRNGEHTLTGDDFTQIVQVFATRRHEDLRNLTAKEQAHHLIGRTHTRLTDERLRALLVRSKESGTPLRVKYGIDPTGAEVHLGHAVPLIIANRLQRMGHHLIILVGDVTAKIGDPSGRSKERPPLSDEDIAGNLATYQAQVAPFVDFTAAELRHNSEWLNALTLPEIMRTLMRVPLAMQLQREDFRKRLEGGHSLSTAELMYSILMAYDSLALDADIEIGGVDQLLNFQMCRKVMEVEGKEPEVVVTTALIEGTDGTGDKMSKSKGNYIALAGEPHDMFGKVMSIPDRLLETYFKALTELTDEEWGVLAERMEAGTLNPAQVKKLLAYDIVQAIHGAESADHAKGAFEAQFSKRSLSEVEALPELHCAEGMTVLTALTTELHFAESNTKARALAKGGGVQMVLEGGTPYSAKLTEDDLMSSCGEVVARVREEAGLSADTPAFLKVGRRAARLLDK